MDLDLNSPWWIFGFCPLDWIFKSKPLNKILIHSKITHMDEDNVKFFYDSWKFSVNGIVESGRVRFALVKFQVLNALKCYVNNQPKLCRKTAFLMNCELLWI